MTKQTKQQNLVIRPAYAQVLDDVSQVVESGRKASVRAVNAVMTASYWLIGQRIVEEEQGGAIRAGYGEELITKLSQDLTARFGRGFSERNLELFRRFFIEWPANADSAVKSSGSKIPQPLVAELEDLEGIGARFQLPWKHYVILMTVKAKIARDFYEAEALRGGWTSRQLYRQIGTQYFERTLRAKDKVAALRKGSSPKPEDVMTPEEELRDPYVLEFLELKDEYSESELEAALVQHLEDFLLELGGEFTFVGRQRRLRIGESWYHVDLVLFHRRLRCLFLADLKLDPLEAAHVGPMHMYLNYARQHWALPGENPPVGLLLTAKHRGAVAKYALQGLPNLILSGEYNLPSEERLVAELEKARRAFEDRRRKR
ncbi:MAG: PDDEXK nuclease domain-containing protein [Myxococcales bacterium]